MRRGERGSLAFQETAQAGSIESLDGRHRRDLVASILKADPIL
jgi:hypothetical protein